MFAPMGSSSNQLKVNYSILRSRPKKKNQKLISLDELKFLQKQVEMDIQSLFQEEIKGNKCTANGT
jgi:hypothetical protein